MYRGFNINYLRESFGIGYETRGFQVQEPIKKKLKESFLRQIIKEDNSLEASLIMTLSRKVCKLKSLGLDFIILAFLQK